MARQARIVGDWEVGVDGVDLNLDGDIE